MEEDGGYVERMKFIKDILRGVAIGIANIIPGVSGGTLMVSMGIYDEVICAVTRVFHHIRESIRTLFPYIVGMGIGIIGLSFVIEYLFAKFPLQTALLFIGLIIGGLPLILPKVKGKNPSLAELAAFVASFGLIVWMQFWSEGTTQVLSAEPKLLISLFFVGTLVAATMVIPGVSGSMILMSMGYYTPIIDYINAFVIALVTLDFSTVWYCMRILVPFGIGVVAGIFLVAKLVEYLLREHERITYFAILGLVASSPIAVLAGMDFGAVSLAAILVGVILFGIGMLVACLLGK